MVGMRRQGRIGTAVTVSVIATSLLTGCAPWLAANPRFASDSARNPGAAPTSAAAAGGAGVQPRHGERRVVLEGGSIEVNGRGTLTRDMERA